MPRSRAVEILLIKLSAIGDVIHTMPALELLERTFPGSRITWVVEERAAGILSGHPSVHKVIVSRRRQWLSDFRKPLRCLSACREVRSFLKELRSTRYDLVIDFQGLFKSALVVFLSRGAHKAGYHRTRELSYLVLDYKIAPPPPDEHAVVKNLALVKALGQLPLQAEQACAAPEAMSAAGPGSHETHSWSSAFPPPASAGIAGTIDQEVEENVEFLLRHARVDPRKPLVIINAPAGWESKRWEIRKTAALADLLIDDYEANILYTGDLHDSPYIGAIVSCMKRPAVNAAGRTSLKELACLMKRADLLISTDSGPLHLAAAMGTPIVALFGPTAPWRTGPWTDRARIVRKHVWCSPCFKRTCPSKICMDEISVAEVLAPVETIMGARREKKDKPPHRSCRADQAEPRHS